MTPTIVVAWNRAALQAVRATRSGPPITARALAVLHTAIFDAWAPYDDVAFGTRLGDMLRRPTGERTDANREQAISFAAHRVLVDLFPSQAAAFDELLRRLGHDPGQPAVLEHGPGQDGQVERGRAVAAGVEAVRVAPGGAAEAEPFRLGLHCPGEPGHRPAGRLGQHHRHVVGGRDHQGLQGLVDGEPLAALHGQPAGRLPGRRPRGHRHLVHVEAGPDGQGGQHLGQAGRRGRRAAPAAPQHRPGGRVDQDRVPGPDLPWPRPDLPWPRRNGPKRQRHHPAVGAPEREGSQPGEPKPPAVHSPRRSPGSGGDPAREQPGGQDGGDQEHPEEPKRQGAAHAHGGRSVPSGRRAGQGHRSGYGRPGIL
jgi:hypothetical protein